METELMNMILCASTRNDYFLAMQLLLDYLVPYTASANESISLSTLPQELVWNLSQLCSSFVDIQEGRAGSSVDVPYANGFPILSASTNVY